MMKIKDIYLQDFGPHKDWSFTPSETGVQLVYGPNESGKTSLLEGIRAILFGKKPKGYDAFVGALTVERDAKEYHIGRNGKQLDFYPVGEARINAEPADLWWHGLDKKTYHRIFGLTLQDLQGTDILTEVDVRTRFFGAEGGERLSSVVKDIEKATNDLLVASANGKRKINVLMEQLKQNRAKITALTNHEKEYVALQAKLLGTEKTEHELTDQLNEWRDYRESIDVVLRAWDTYRRAEEAKQQIHQFTDGGTLERAAFQELDQELSRCREHMRIWQGKEEGLMPENFSPQSPLGTYGQDIEDLYQQVAKWDQLRRDCEQGEAYLRKVKDQLDLSRRMHTTWRDSEDMASDINWYEGERLARNLRSAREKYEQWQLRKPVAQGIVGTGRISDDNGHMVGATTVVAAETSTVGTTSATTNISNTGKTIIVTVDSQQQVLEVEQRMLQSKQGFRKPYMLGGMGVALIGIIFVLVGLFGLDSMGLFWLGFVLVIIAIGIWGYAYWTSSAIDHRLRHITEELEFIRKAAADEIKAHQDHIVADNVAQLLSHGEAEKMQAWVEEGQFLENEGSAAMKAWQEWLPPGAARTLTDVDFFGMKQEYDQYQEQVKVYEGYEKRLREHKDELQTIEDETQTLWDHLGSAEPVTPVELRRLYSQLKSFHQNKIRWEQKETQRKNFREEYDQWHRKEKNLLLRQKELLEKAGIGTAGEYRQKLLHADQLKQWETIYRQSQVQLDLIAPTAENRDLFYRRLRGGDKGKWVDEVNRSDEEIAMIQQKLALLYEERGSIAEAMRTLGSDQAQAMAIQEQKGLEGQLETALGDWVTQVLISHCMDAAQKVYEEEKQPHMLSIASDYIHQLTDGKYTLHSVSTDEPVSLTDVRGERVDSTHWSSGLADQVYLALRLSLAKAFSNRVEAMPIILDDILLRFDEDRQKRALSLLASIGAEQQVFIFTCQSELLRLGKQQSGIDMYIMAEHGVRPF